MKSPLIIIIELFAGVISSAISTILFIIGKLGELAVSLVFVSSLGIFGLFIAIIIGAIVFFFFAKIIFKTGKSLFAFIIALVAVLLVLLLISMF